MKTAAAVLRSVCDERPYDRSRPLILEELHLDEPRAGELLIRIAAAGVCHSDLSVVDGARVRPLPMALGHEAAGVVEAVGPGVRDVRVGDHVVLTFVPSCGHCGECTTGRPALCLPAAAANGAGHLLHGPGRLADASGNPIHHHLGVSGFAEYTVVARESAVVIPQEVPLPTAALFGCAMLTGVGAVLNTATVRPGQSVAVFGLGGVGLAAVMGAAVAGAVPIVAVDPFEHKREVARSLGATLTMTPEEAAQGLTVDFAFEAAGVPAVLEAAFKATRRGGTTVAIGLPHPQKTVSLPALAFAAEGKALIGSYMGSASPQRDIPRLIALWQAGRLPVESLHSATLPLAEINRALEELASGRAIRQILIPRA
ncbi:MAG: alcohol dehydrogenase catalytic domain-containing protein [Cyanobacteria bacterium REEB65]|nr:alcohol dehydrogenase catalytic domain-containing protein [Cyanobacteria bacterium REEB65]